MRARASGASGARKAAVVATALASLVAAQGGAQQFTVPPRVVHIDKVTCAELLGLDGDERDRLMIYLNGYLDGRRQQHTWNAEVVGKRVDRALASCKANPSATVLATFTKAWDR